MKVLIVNTTEYEGGAGIAANRLHQGLKKHNIDSHMLVMKKNSNDYTVHSPFSSLMQEYVRVLPTISVLPLLYYKNRKRKRLFSPGLFALDLKNKIQDIKPDIIHLHWINAGFLNINSLAGLDTPIVWSMHDMWPITGGCHYDEGCSTYKNSCGNCPLLLSNCSSDISYRQFKQKQRVYNRLNLHYVGLSKWIYNCAAESSLLKDKPIYNLPNCIDTEIYSPMDKETAKELAGLEKNARYVLFTSMFDLQDERKGFKYLNSALNILDENFELLVLGSKKPKLNQEFKQNATYLGSLNDDLSKRIIFNSADVVVVPSTQENFSNVIVESLSCGTPVVGFDIGGNKDLIVHKQNGYLAVPFEADDLASGIQFVLEDVKGILSNNARAHIENTVSENVVVPKYIELYDSILQ